MNKFFLLLLASACLLSQSVNGQDTVQPAVEFTTTTNASRVGVNFVMGYQFTVQAPVILTSLGAVLQGNSVQPVFGALPASMQVGLWDDAKNLLVSAAVSNSDPLVGHFNYTPVAETRLLPGVSYTIAGLVPSGASVLSDVPAMTPGSLVVYGGPRSFVSSTLAFPAGDVIRLRGNYFGASFTYSGAPSPIARSGHDRYVATGVPVILDGSASFGSSGDLLNGSPLTWKWALVSKPVGSAVELSGADSPAPSFVPDRPGVYVAQLIVQEESARSRPSTVSITVAGAR
jgi:hypothetical protein